MSGWLSQPCIQSKSCPSRRQKGAKRNVRTDERRLVLWAITSTMTSDLRRVVICRCFCFRCHLALMTNTAIIELPISPFRRGETECSAHRLFLFRLCRFAFFAHLRKDVRWGTNWGTSRGSMHIPTVRETGSVPPSIIRVCCTRCYTPTHAICDLFGFDEQE